MWNKYMFNNETLFQKNLKNVSLRGFILKICFISLPKQKDPQHILECFKMLLLYRKVKYFYLHKFYTDYRK